MSSTTIAAICLTSLVMLTMASLIRIEKIQEGIKRKLTEIERILKEQKL